MMKASIDRATAKPLSERDPAAPIELGPLTRRFGYYLRRLQHAYKKHFSASAGGVDVQARDVGPLFVIGLNPGITPSQLAAALMMDAAPVTTMLNTFAAKGWIVRHVSSADARSRVIYLTPEGQTILALVRRIEGKIDQHFLSTALTAEESKQLIGLLAKLLAAHRNTDD
jgi:DNA-binding MarR family transcriptional regulator